MNTSDFINAFKKPFLEAINYMKKKSIMPTTSWNDIVGKAHQKTFTIAKVTKLDMLQDVQDLLISSMQNGMSWADFKNDFLSLVSQKGWVVDPSLPAEEKKIKKPWRIETIFRTNMQNSFATGRWDQMMKSTKLLPYLQYDAVDDSQTRPAHKALDGIIARYDDPLWEKFAPTNGYNCRCRLNVVPDPNPPEKDISSGVGRIEDKIDEKSGMPYSIYTTPSGKEIKTDLGWNFNPGKTTQIRKKYSKNIAKIAEKEVPAVIVETKPEPYRSPYHPESIDKRVPGVLPEKFFDEIGRKPTVQFIDQKAGRSYCSSPGNVTIYTQSKTTDYALRRVVVHELAHALYMSKGVGDYAKKVSKMLKDCKKEIDSKMDDLKDIFNATNYTEFDNYIIEQTKNVDEAGVHNFKDKLGAVADTIASATKAILGWGHTKSYFKEENMRLHEFHSHAAELYFSGNEQLEKFLPETAKAMKEHWKKTMEESNE